MNNIHLLALKTFVLSVLFPGVIYYFKGAEMTVLYMILSNGFNDVTIKMLNESIKLITAHIDNER